MNNQEYELKLKEILNMPWKNIGPDLKDSLALLSTIIALCVLFFCVSCSMTFSVVNTHGKAEDVLDTEHSTEGELSPELSLPFEVV